MKLPKKSINIEELKKSAKTKTRDSGRKARRRLFILQRDEFRCVNCGSTDNLTIAHIKSIKELGVSRFAATSWKPDNCKTLCVNCHIKEDFGEMNK